MNRSSYRYRGADQVDAVYREVMRLSVRYSYWGYRKIYDLMDRDQFPVGRERVRLIRAREGLQVVKKVKKKKVLGRSTQWVYRAEYPNHVWSYDFVSDRIIDGRTLKCLTVVEEFTREGLEIHCATSITATDVIAVLAELIAQHGRPVCLRSDNGPEFIATAVKEWLAEHSIGTHYIDPGSPWQNAFNESFNSIFRTTCLNRWDFESVTESRAVTDQWLDEYNTVRPHGSLGGRSPAQFIEDWVNAHSQNQQ
jgi:transposase InsO family protein